MKDSDGKVWGEQSFSAIPPTWPRASRAPPVDTLDTPTPFADRPHRPCVSDNSGIWPKQYTCAHDGHDAF